MVIKFKKIFFDYQNISIFNKFFINHSKPKFSTYENIKNPSP